MKPATQPELLDLCLSVCVYLNIHTHDCCWMFAEIFSVTESQTSSTHSLTTELLQLLQLLHLLGQPLQHGDFSSTHVATLPVFLSHCLSSWRVGVHLFKSCVICVSFVCFVFQKPIQYFFSQTSDQTC